jgi:hypothetical protein
LETKKRISKNRWLVLWRSCERGQCNGLLIWKFNSVTGMPQALSHVVFCLLILSLSLLSSPKHHIKRKPFAVGPVTSISNLPSQNTKMAAAIHTHGASVSFSWPLKLLSC